MKNLLNFRGLLLALLPLLAAITCVLQPNGGLVITVPPLGDFFPVLEGVLPALREYAPFLVLFYEGAARAFPTLRDWSLFNFLGRFLDWLFPNVSREGFRHKVVTNYAA